MKRWVAVFNALMLRGMGSGVSVLFTILVARYLDDAAAARFFLLFNVSVIAAVCFRWGMDEVIIRRVASVPRDYAPALAESLVGLSHLRVMMWGFFALLVSLGVLVPDIRLALKGIGATDALMVLSASAMAALAACGARVQQGLGRTNYAAFLLNIMIPLSALLGLLVLVVSHIQISASGLMLVYVGAALAAYLLSVSVPYGGPLRLLRGGRAFAESSDAALDRRAANKLGVVVVAQQAINWAAFLIVPVVYGDSLYKGFVVAHKLALLVSLVMLAVNFTLSSRFAAMYAEGRLGELRGVVRIAMVAILAASMVAAVFMLLMSGYAFSFARIQTDMGMVLMVLLVSQVFFALASLYAVVLSMCRDDNFLLAAQGGINFAAVLVFMILSQFCSIEITCLAFVLGYLVLALTLGWRVHTITSR